MARDKEFRSRDKKTQRMTRDGLVEVNQTTGEESRISQRGQDFQLKQRLDAPGTAAPDTAPVRGDSARSSHSHRQPTAQEATQTADSQQPGGLRQDDAPIRASDAPVSDSPGHSAANTPVQGGSPHHPYQADGGRLPKQSQHPTSPDTTHRQHDSGYYQQFRDEPHGQEAVPSHQPYSVAGQQPIDTADTGRTAYPAPDFSAPLTSEEAPAIPTDTHSRLRFADSPQPTTTSAQRQHGTKYARQITGEPPAVDPVHIPLYSEPEANPAYIDVEQSVIPVPISTPGEIPTSPLSGIGDAPTSVPAPDRPGRLRLDTAQTQPTTVVPRQKGTQYARRFATDPEASEPTPAKPVTTDSAHSGDSSTPKEPPPTSGKKASRLQFGNDEVPPDSASDRKISKLQGKAEKTGTKLKKARGKLPTKKRLRTRRVFDEKAGKPKPKIYFEKEVKSQREHLKGPVLTRPVKAGGNAALGFAHGKIHQVEHENVGVQAGHRGALLAESVARRAYRLHKTAPYRKVEKLERLATKQNIKLAYQQALRDNPKLRGNALSKFIQKQRIKRQYAKAARDSKRAAGAAKKAGGLVADVTKAIASFASKHPAFFGTIAALVLLVLIMMSMFGSCSQMGAGLMSSVLSTSYLAEDKDIDDAELAYTEWETDLQDQINNAESDNLGFDEYRYNVGDISHDPYELMAYLTAKYQDFTFADVRADLQAIFNEQYTLTFTEEVEVRYRTEYYTDDDGNEQSTEVPYNWYILNVNLTSRSFTDIVTSRLNSEQRQIFDILMTSKGNRQYALNPFSFNWLPYVTSNYGWRIHPVTGEKDYHKGIDIGVPTGTQIVASHDGKVIQAAFDAGGYGWYVAIEGKDGVVTKYAHCDSLEISVGQEVKKGDPIAKSGNSGNSTGPHLHFEVLKNGQYLNPLFFAITGDDGSSRIPPGSPGGIDFPEYPGAPMGDGTFAALMEEAQKHLGKAYVFGAKGPNTFDCSGFVSWSLSKSGVRNIAAGAQGLFNASTPVSAANAQPGDLIFFQGTYSTPNTVTHVGIYIGNGMMLHAGSPVQYASINTTYWQNHFYAFGRIN